MKRITASAALSGLALLTSCAHLAEIGPSARDAAPTAASTRDAPRRETITVAADELIPNLPGKRLVSHVVDYAPGAASAPHRHARSAFVYAYVVSGAIRSQVDDGPLRVYRAGETWFESPGAHHRVSENASDTEPARLLAVIIVDAADKQVTLPEAK
ncbi:MAG TPA: cupin domain-containing protein [Gemmatimonadaceae bacterium]